MNEPPSNPDLRSSSVETASCEPIYWSRVDDNCDILGLAAVLIIRGFEGAVGNECWLAIRFRSSIISRSISAFLLRFPTRLKFCSILH